MFKSVLNLLDNKQHYRLNRSLLLHLRNANLTLLLTIMLDRFRYFKCNPYYWEIPKIAENLFLDKKTVSKYIATLQDMGLITIERKGIPFRNYFSFNTENQKKLMDIFNEENIVPNYSDECEDYYTDTQNRDIIDTENGIVINPKSNSYIDTKNGISIEPKNGMNIYNHNKDNHNKDNHNKDNHNKNKSKEYLSVSFFEEYINSFNDTLFKLKYTDDNGKEEEPKERLKRLFEIFINQRQTAKKKTLLTSLAGQRLLSKLKSLKYATDVGYVIDCIEEAIVRDWETVYDLNDELFAIYCSKIDKLLTSEHVPHETNDTVLNINNNEPPDTRYDRKPTGIFDPNYKPVTDDNEPPDTRYDRKPTGIFAPDYKPVIDENEPPDTRYDRKPTGIFAPKEGNNE